MSRNLIAALKNFGEKLNGKVPLGSDLVTVIDNIAADYTGGGGSGDGGQDHEKTVLFSGTVTTEDQHNGMYKGYFLVESGGISAETITVTFDGTEYECSRNDMNGAYYYGGFSTQEPDFTDYPFLIENMNGTNGIYTETAGTYTITVASE